MILRRHIKARGYAPVTSAATLSWAGGAICALGEPGVITTTDSYSWQSLAICAQVETPVAPIVLSGANFGWSTDAICAQVEPGPIKLTGSSLSWGNSSLCALVQPPAVALTGTAFSWMSSGVCVLEDGVPQEEEPMTTYASFDGANDYYSLILPVDTFFGASVTIEFDLFLNEFSSNGFMPLSPKTYTGLWWEFVNPLVLNGSNAMWIGGIGTIYLTQAIIKKEWVKIKIYHDQSGVSIYQNGVLIGQNPTLIDIPNAECEWHIGTYAHADGWFLNGGMKNLKLYRENTAIGHYPMNGNGLDASGNNYNLIERNGLTYKPL